MPTVSSCIYSDGSVVRCPDNGKIYQIEGGAKRWFATLADFQAAAVPVDIDSAEVCSRRDACPDGANM
ncbi:hypothetical protein D9Q98_009892 [Chlorella vulgaris]|uniref:Uncharacterized protein n=1 Tax=Chlorella vulgaris TaxID=3077 RepID=A0A9D4TFS7_CHLVU|nr:hypothetical protein D9Q98_009892 [Chlorella vulgaris]